jgi:predicted DNA binding CopG/RHH family protein
MKQEYDFSKSRPNPYAKRLKRAITIRIDQDALQYFKDTANKMHIPYQTLINLYLKDCLVHKRKPTFKWQ